MSNRRHHVVSAAVVAASIALAPCAAFASSPAQSNRPHISASVPKALAKTSSSVFKTFTSTSKGSGSHTGPMAKSATAGPTIYVRSVAGVCQAGYGTGTAADPFCSLNAALAAAVSGDTISMAAGSYDYGTTATVTISNLTIVSTGGYAAINASNASAEAPELVIDGASNVSISGLDLQGYGVPSVEIEGSSSVTLDSDELNSYYGIAAGALTIDGTSSGVTVSRTLFSD